MRRWSPYNYAFDNPMRFIDPDGREALTGESARQAFTTLRDSWAASANAVNPPVDYVNSDGNKIGTDGTTDKGIVMITNRHDVNAIRSAERRNNHVTLDQLSEFNANMIVPTDESLNETLNVVDRGSANGGLREESSIVDGSIVFRGETGPLPTVGTDGMALAPAQLPQPLLSSGRSRTSIHLHPTGIFESRGQSFPFNALTPTRGTDDKVFAQYGTNIIAGRLEVGNSSNITKNADGSYNDSRPIGAAVYNSNGTFRMKLTIPVIRNILNRNSR